MNLTINFTVVSMLSFDEFSLPIDGGTRGTIEDVFRDLLPLHLATMDEYDDDRRLFDEVELIHADMEVRRNQCVKLEPNLPLSNLCGRARALGGAISVYIYAN